MAKSDATHWIEEDRPGCRARRPDAGRCFSVLAILLAGAVLGLTFIGAARAGECGGGGGGGGGGGAGTDALFDKISRSLTAETLSVELAQQSVGGSCLSVYVVKVLTPGGAVAVLSYDAESLDLVEVEGPDEDETVAELAERVRSVDDDEGEIARDGNTDGSSDSGTEGGVDSSGSDGGDSGGDSGGGSDGGGSDGGDSGGGDSGGGDSGGGDSGGGDSGGGESDGGDD